MTNQTKVTRQRFSGEQVTAMCRLLSSGGEAVFEYMDHLQTSGFAAFIPYCEFVESFGESAAEKAVHRQCVVEGAKLRLGQPWPLRMIPEYREHIYKSEILERLGAARDAVNGVPSEQLSSRYPGEIWRYEIDPCERRKVYFELTEREAYAERWQMVLQSQRQLLESETSRHVSGPTKDFDFDESGRYAFFTMAMEREASHLGFLYDAAMSRPNYPVFSRPVSANWRLCWTIEDSRLFVWGPLDGLFEPHLGVRHRNLRGPVQKAGPGEFMFIQYQHVVPGFGGAYLTFHDLNELEVMIKSHLHLYSLMASTIDKALKEALE